MTAVVRALYGRRTMRVAVGVQCVRQPSYNPQNARIIQPSKNYHADKSAYCVQQPANGPYKTGPTLFL